jgi:hypothetical protein
MRLQDTVTVRDERLTLLATAERAVTQRDGDVEKSQLDDAPIVPGETDGTTERR